MRMENVKSKHDEQLFIKRLEDLVQSSGRKMAQSFTDFLDPKQQIITSDYFRNNKTISIDFYGGYKEAERKICGIYCKSAELDKDEYPIAILHLSWRSHKKIKHRDILGSLIGAGIRREKIGDIIQNNDEAFVFVHRDIAGYLVNNLEEVGSTNIDIECCDDLPELEQEQKSTSAVVASLRLDCLLAAGFGVSRTTAAEAIKSSKVFINWKPEGGPSKEVRVGDVISWRGKGRVKLDHVIGTTKKDRIKVNIIKYI